MELLWSTRSRGRQPLGWPKVKASWLARGLAFASTLADPRPPNAVTGRISLLSGTRTGPGAFGIARYIGAASTDIVDTSFTGSGRPGGWRTIVVRGMQNSSGGGTFGRMLDKEGEFAVYTTGSTLRYTQVFDGVAGIWDVPYTATGKPFTLVITHDRSVDTSVPIMMVDGVALTVTTFTPASGTRVLSSNRMQIGNRASDWSRNWDGWLADVLIIDGSLGGHETRSLSRDPWQVFEEEIRPAFYSATPPPGAAIASHTIAAFGQTATARPIPRASATHSIPAFGRSASASLAEYVVWDNYERSSVNVALSTITGGSGDAALITLAPRLQESEVVSGTRWLEPSARVTGVNGKRPTFRFSGYNVTQGDGTQHGDWASTRRPKFSYDRVTWYDFDTQTIGSTYIEFRNSVVGHNTFTADTVYISRARQMSVEQVGAWLASLGSTYPTLIGPAPSASAYTPSGSVSGFSGQTFIADEFSTQTDELGRTIPVTPFYAAMIDDPQVPTLVNLLTYTEDFSNAAWSKTGGPIPVVTADQVASPGGTTTADRIFFSTAGASQRVGQTVGARSGPVTSSIWLRGDVGGESISLWNGAATTSTVTLTTTWTRYSVTQTMTGGTVGCYLTAPSGTPTIYAWGAQVEYGPNATPYQKVVASGTAGKRLAVLASGVHAGEDHANFVHRAVVERLLGSSAEAIQIRKNYRIAVPPLFNPPGRAGGGWRGSFTQGVSGEDDANRHFNEIGTTLEIIDKPKAALTTDRAGSLVAWAIDFHGTYGSTWASFEDASVPASAAFRSRLATEAGFAITDEGDSHAGFLSEYLRGFGAAFAVTVESGDPSPVSDAEITAFAKAVVRTISGMAVTILSSATQIVPGFTHVATARPRVAGTAAQTVSAFTQSATARPRVKATTAQSIAAFTQVATVIHAVPALATATQIIPAFVHTASVVHGAVARATATQVVAAFTSAAAAKPRVRATSAQALQPFAQAANATIRFTSTAGASQSVPAFTSAGTAKARAAASAARVIEAFQANATAAVRARATATQAIQAFAQSASIGEIPPRTASAAQQVPAFLAAQVAMVRLRLQGSQTITPFPQTATARDPAAAPSAAYLPATITAVLSVKEFEVRLG